MKTPEERIAELKAIIYDLILMVEDAQIHPVTSANVHPELVKAAEMLGEKAALL